MSSSAGRAGSTGRAGKRRAAAAALGGACLVGIVGTAVWPAQDDGDPPPARARQYAASQACLLTGQQGVAEPEAAEVWGAMQDSSSATAGKVSSLPVIGDQSVGNAVPYANTLVARKCDVVLAAGSVQVQAVTQIAPANPAVRFLVVGEAAAGGNVTVVAPGPQTRAKVADALTKAFGALKG
ncbi:BMP family ABC transporter substrate-binding protein [Kitasatospora sp. NPDC056446]|uniref:BMP family ABC transporter substrate-binding protein n=1 Tax=Kitasatospora sp. NPDC056446 TaxID=3345819 RepID=UPI00369AA45E